MFTNKTYTANNIHRHNVNYGKMYTDKTYTATKRILTKLFCHKIHTATNVHGDRRYTATKRILKKSYMWVMLGYLKFGFGLVR